MISQDTTRSKPVILSFIPFYANCNKLESSGWPIITNWWGGQHWSVSLRKGNANKSHYDAEWHFEMHAEHKNGKQNLV